MFFMGYNQKKYFLGSKKKNKAGFSLIEMIMVMTIIGILAGGSGYLMVGLIQNSVFIPNQLNMDMLACDALDIMMEGDPLAQGLRFSRQITNIQDNQVTFIYKDNNQNNVTVIYRWDSALKRLFRSINGVEKAIPYYIIVSGITVTPKTSKLFTYYDASDLVINPLSGNPANVRRIEVTLIARTGTGSYTSWEGQSEQTSSIAVKKFQ